MPHPCDHPLYIAYRNAVRVVFHTTFNDEAEEDAAVATMQVVERGNAMSLLFAAATLITAVAAITALFAIVYNFTNIGE